MVLQLSLNEMRTLVIFRLLKLWVIRVYLCSVDPLPSIRIPSNELSHWNSEQRQELTTLLDSYCDCFTEKPGFCTLVEHELRMKP